jgi:hypothetical protein
VVAVGFSSFIAGNECVGTQIMAHSVEKTKPQQIPEINTVFMHVQTARVYRPQPNFQTEIIEKIISLEYYFRSRNYELKIYFF